MPEFTTKYPRKQVQRMNPRVVNNELTLDAASVIFPNITEKTWESGLESTQG